MLHDFTGGLGTYDAIKHWVVGPGPSPVAMVWCERGADDTRAIQLRARSPAYGDPGLLLDVSVPTAVAADTVLDWLAGPRLVSRVPMPSWYRPPPASLSRRYHRSVQGLLYFGLAKYGDLGPLQIKTYPQFIEEAFDLANEPEAPPQCRIFPLTLTMLAAEVGMLDVGHRRRALDVVRAATTPGDLLTWLAPQAFRALDAEEEAVARATALAAEPDLSAPYKAWLDAIAKPAA